MNKNIIADMHTHSESSHDSVCKIEDMCLSQISKGTKIMAVTDHCDIFSYRNYDIYTPIANAYNTVKSLNKTHKNEFLLLSGVEISEGFWFPKECDKILNLVPYDVIIGSVHSVRYKNLTKAYSKLDFSKFSKAEIYEYLDAYFDDVLAMLDFMDFDILAHLTCPLRYIIGKYNIEIDMNVFEEKIISILKCIIDRKIALEINTSSFSELNDFMPSRSIIKQYRDMGGYLITLGSDAHVSENASLHFNEAIAFIKEIGLKNIFYYKDRKSYQCSI